MNTLQQELRSTYPVLRIQLLGVNAKGQESGNDSATAGRTLPWLQDVDANGNGQGDVAGDLWKPTYRDVVILNGTNEQVGVYNLTLHDLKEPAFYGTLRDMLVDAAMASQKPWSNPVDPVDVDNSGDVSALDALIVINMLNSPKGSHKLPPPTSARPIDYFYDTNGDGDVSPIDVLVVINHLNSRPLAQGGEGESVELVAQVPAAFPPASPEFADRVPAPCVLHATTDNTEVFRALRRSRLAQPATTADDEAQSEHQDHVVAFAAVDWPGSDLEALVAELLSRPNLSP
jgi:hypothetical protein